MTDEEVIEKIRAYCRQTEIHVSLLGDKVTDVASFCMGAAATCPYANFGEHYQPWTPQFQAARVMRLFYDSPSAISMTLVLYTLSRLNLAPLQHANFVEGVRYSMSDYAYRKLTQTLAQQPCTISRTYNLVVTIVAMAKTLNVLTDGNQSMPLDYVESQIHRARMDLMSMCNADVDAHPLAKSVLSDLVDTVEEIINRGKVDAA